MNLYLLLIMSYWNTYCPVIKALPCCLLYYQTENIAFLFSALGDYFLATNRLLPGLIVFSISNIILFHLESFETFVIYPFIFIQPLLIYTFSWYVFIVNIYVITLLNMLSRKTLPTTLFVISDFFVLLQFLDYPVSYISLPLYWTAMWMFKCNHISQHDY